ncbi:hypothetical protein E1B28_007063 [Marasmius oreades]|uniref:Uncharacterized protein n=1 Tax=Marasmius oreades TaxID=181124 RepID=A0A9P7S1H8_9AGAR|nr:uncharacterized protein E1B28_007063 [Marasmius oreades]KAG7093382.1 hypothetical protein E1B28_007063 [Marasmius oreades]
MVLHVRSGERYRWRSSFLGYNSFPEFPERLGWKLDVLIEVDNEEWRWVNVYQTQCYPTIEQIVNRVNEIQTAHHARVTRDGSRLKRWYIMTDGKREWLRELGVAFHASSSEKWDGISTSRDLDLSPEQKQTLDTYTGSRSAVFVGNEMSVFFFVSLLTGSAYFVRFPLVLKYDFVHCHATKFNRATLDAMNVFVGGSCTSISMHIRLLLLMQTVAMDFCYIHPYTSPLKDPYQP